MNHLWVTWTIDVWHYSLRYDMTPSFATWLIHMRHDSFIRFVNHSCMTRCIHMLHNWFICGKTHSCMIRLIHVRHDLFICGMTHSCVTDSFIPYLHFCYFNRRVAQHQSFFLCVSSSSLLKHTTACLLASILLFFWKTKKQGFSVWPFFVKTKARWIIWDMTYSYVTRPIHVWYDPFRCNMIHACIYMTHDSFMCHDSLICVYMGHDSFMVLSVVYVYSRTLSGVYDRPYVAVIHLF